jgi:hypothetical protein
MRRIAFSIVIALSGAALSVAALARQPDKGPPDKEQPPAKDSPHAEAVKQTLDVLDQMSAGLAKITDQDSAGAAKEELAKLAKTWTALRQKTEKLPPPAREEKQRLEKEYKGKMEAAQRKLAGEVRRVELIPGGRAALQEIRGVLKPPAK